MLRTVIDWDRTWSLWSVTLK